MTDKELTIWEHLDSVIRVLTSKEMGAWLYRRDKRVLETELEKIKAEVDKKYDELYVIDEFTNGEASAYAKILEIVNEHMDELKGEQE